MSSDAGASPTAASVTDYVQKHHIHVLLDRMVKDILVEKPTESDPWMLRWFLEQHRLECAKKHRDQSPAKGTLGSVGSVDDVEDTDMPLRSTSPTR